MRIDNKLILEYSKNLSILYVEDDENLRKSTFEIFKNYFSSVDLAADGQEGISKYKSYFKDNERNYDIVISDINMPTMNGIEMANHIMQEHYDQAIIFITAHNEVEYLQRSIDLGISGFIAKPIKIEQLKKVLYTVTQSVFDRKIAHLHYEIIEKLNIDLQLKNEALEKSLRVLNTIINQKTKVQNEHIKEPIVEQNMIDKQPQIELFVSDDLEEIRDIHQEIDSKVVYVINAQDEDVSVYIKQISRGFTQYSSILSFYSFFHDLSRTMKEFSIVLDDTSLPDDKFLVHDTFVLLESFMFVLGKWSEKLSDGDNEQLNDLDASLISDMQTIISMWTNSDHKGEIEFF